MTPQELERFFKYVVPEPNSGCWLWVGSCALRGYAQFWLKRQRYAYQVSYEHFKGPIPNGLELDHLCRTITCVNPAHLEAVTHRENDLRGKGFVAENARKTHCPRGHEYSPENTFWQGPTRSYRGCKECNRRKAFEHYHRLVNANGG